MITQLVQPVRLLLFSAAVIPAVVIDLKTRRIPDLLSFGGLLLLGLCDLFTGSPAGFAGSALAAAAAFLLFWLIRRFTGGMGLGDAKLAALVGFLVGPWGLPFALLIAGAGGLVYALVALKFLGRAEGERIPFAPFLAAGGYGAAFLRLAGLNFF